MSPPESTFLTQRRTLLFFAMSFSRLPARTSLRFCLGLVLTVAGIGSVRADATYFPLSSGRFFQDWSETSSITANDDWSKVTGIIGHLGQDMVTTTGANPQTVLNVSTLGNDVDVIANQNNPTATAGGVAEFDGIDNPTIALQGSGTADAPYLLVHLNTLGRSNISVSYRLRDLDTTTDNSVQAVALHYRVGDTGPFINVPEAFVADATTGPSLANVEFPVRVTLPTAVNNQSRIQIRILTTNAAGIDEWVGVDDIEVTSTGSLPGVEVSQSNGNTAVSEEGTTDTYTLALSVAPAGPVTVRVAADPQLQLSIGGNAFASSHDLTFTSTAPQTVSVRAANDAVFEDQHTGTITHSILATADSAAYPPTLVIPSVTVSITDNDAPSSSTRISQIQGSGAASPRVNATVAVSGVVTGFQTGSTGAREGFFVQEEDHEADNDPATSEGLYVYTPATSPLASTTATLALGDVVTAIGKVIEFNGLTELTTEGVSVAAITKTGTAPLPTPAILVFPSASPTAFERFEAMRITVPETLTVTGSEALGQYGELVLASGGRTFTPTHTIDPNDVVASGTSTNGSGNVPAVTAQATANTLRRILLDDGSSRTYPDPTPFLSSSDPATATRRVGDTLTGFTGILTHGFGTYRLIPTGPVTFVSANPRTPTPPSVGGTLRVASFNVLNYFVTLGGSNDRGASNASEFARQRTKIIAALKAMNADVVGLIEIQNRSDLPSSHRDQALADLVTALNASIGASASYVALPSPSAGTGTDYIRVAFIYRSDRVSPVGTSYSDTDTVFQRPPLAQLFRETRSGATFLACINHFKSKGSGSGADADQNDGQGASNVSRRAQATRLVQFLESVKTTTGENDVLILGDLNAYAEEDPIDVLRAAGYVDLISRFSTSAANRYSYVFENESGYLDHALASPSLVSQVNRAVEWHINADEPAFLDYNLELNPNNPGAGLKSASQQAINVGTPFRSSDHDPVLVGLSLVADAVATAPTIVTPPTAQSIVLGRTASLSVVASGIPAPNYQWQRNGVDIPGATSPTLVFPRVTENDGGTYTVIATNAAGSVMSTPRVITVVTQAPFTISTGPASQSLSIGGTATFSVTATGAGPFSYQWFVNGRILGGATSSSLTLSPVSIQHVGAYTVEITSAGVVENSSPALLGITSTSKVVGTGVEVASDIRHPNGNVYDQILLTGTAAVITADPGQVTRMSYIDLNDDIVQVEFSGPGSVALTLDEASGPAVPVLYNQAVTYIKGHASIIVSGAGASTHLAVFSVGRANAVNQALFSNDVTYDGVADLALVGITSPTGNFGGFRGSNASFFSHRGTIGVSAAGIQFSGPTYVGDITAFDAATPRLILGTGTDVRMAGGDLSQPNGRLVQIKGFSTLIFAAGTTSHGTGLPAQPNRARLEQDGVDVTDLITIRSTP